MPERIVAIHQANFFPWLGYFDKIRRADIFIFLDDVQCPKTGGVWANRVKILHGGDARWLTAPIDRTYSGVRMMNEIRFSDKGNWREKILNSLRIYYSRAAFFEEAQALLTPLIANPDDDVTGYNIRAIEALCRAFGLQGKQMLRSSTLGVEGAATERLIALTRAVGGTEYLCGGGSEGYQEDALFAQRGLRLTYQNFTGRPYAQHGAEAFVSGLSVIDALMHTGVAAVAREMQASTAPGAERAEA